MTRQILLAFLGFYQRWLSPAIHVLSPWGCRYRPTCSEYAIEAVSLHGTARGSLMAMRRLLRCHPLARSGFDPVPLPVERPHEPKADSLSARPARSLH
jgi:putative membrane protein insertion efficiency factor